jgi:hypothetical protein
VRRTTILVATVALGLLAITSWLSAAAYPGAVPAGDYTPHRVEPWTLQGPDADARRLDALVRATFDWPADIAATHDDEGDGDVSDPLSRPVPICRFIETELSGTTPKFDCVFPGGDIVKVKYGRNPETHAEAAATRLLRLLGYAADSVRIIPRLRCYGCPRDPFVATYLHAAFALPLLASNAPSGGYTDFEWVAVERKFPAHAIETETMQGWAWWELAISGAPRADVDAFRLTAVFLAHWDNKSANQRLVCLDDPLPAGDAPCARPLALIQDVGATFGPMKVNLARWRELPIWYDHTSCLVSMRALPFAGATFRDVYISEAGRLQFAERVSAITDEEIERLFAESRFPEFQVGTDDGRDLKAWRTAFHERVQQVVSAGPCPQ